VGGSVLERPAVQRVRDALERAGIETSIHVQDDRAHSAAEAAAALGIAVGQIASSIVFRLPDDRPLLVITSGRHRVDVDLVARTLGVEALSRADADYVKAWSGFSIGGVSPVGWTSELSAGVTPEGVPLEVTVLLDEALGAYDVVWAAAGHPHAVFPTTFEALRRASGARVARVAQD
jgi:prolyl-tRNA editing enzyme YbaK/EbsC (Cys-tRNA(Pro) deacylase)